MLCHLLKSLHFCLSLMFLCLAFDLPHLPSLNQLFPGFWMVFSVLNTLSSFWYSPSPAFDTINNFLLYFALLSLGLLDSVLSKPWGMNKNCPEKLHFSNRNSLIPLKVLRCFSSEVTLTFVSNFTFVWTVGANKNLQNPFEKFSLVVKKFISHPLILLSGIAASCWT